MINHIKSTSNEFNPLHAEFILRDTDSIFAIHIIPQYWVISGSSAFLMKKKDPFNPHATDAMATQGVFLTTVQISIVILDDDHLSWQNINIQSYVRRR